MKTLNLNPMRACLCLRTILTVALVALGCAAAARAQLPAISFSQTGACCDLTTGSCSFRTRASCLLGDFKAGRPCTPNPCTRGACCDPNTGGCTLTTQLGCLFNYSGNGITCQQAHCPQPVKGACCNATSGACRFIPKRDCPILDVWIVNRVCSPNPCTQPIVGACCDVLSGACSIKSFLDCTTSLRSYHGDGSACSMAQCGRGACCDLFTGSCTLSTQAACGLNHWKGVGRTCTPTRCD